MLLAIECVCGFNGEVIVVDNNSTDNTSLIAKSRSVKVVFEPINQIASITTPEARMINIQVWDTNNVELVDSAIKKSELGLNPQIDGQLIRLPVPDLSEERRIEIKKVIKSMGEKCKVSIRNIRREAKDELKNLFKAKDIGEDDEKKYEKIVQTFTDDHIKKIDEKVDFKEKEIMTI